MSEIFFALCKSIDSPISLGAWLRFKHNQLALAELRVDPRDYLNAQRFRQDYCVVSFLSKWMGLNTGIDLESVALQSFATSEAQCKESNSRIKRSRTEAIEPLLSSVIFTAKRKIQRLLGEFSLFKIEPWFGWGPGATSDMRRREAFVDTKMRKLPISVTREALDVFLSVLSTDLHWSAACLGVRVEDLVGPFSFLDGICTIHRACTVTTVPKSAKTHRVIAMEPRANGFLQKGFGGYFRRQLKRVGINLDSQEANQEGARRALKEGLATLDLKAASDSMPIELVYELLPLDWADALNSVRSHKAVLPSGEVITLQKFSSMGNGFTFELETLIFWALASSVADVLEVEAEILVYGDDIICPQGIAKEVVAALKWAGFETNDQKSYISGRFYESCGKHYFDGIDVTPVYQKSELDQPHELIRCGNRIIRCAMRHGAHDSLAGYLEKAWNAVRRQGWDSRLLQLPLGAEGDDGWLVPDADFKPVPLDKTYGMRCNVARSVPRSLPGDDTALLAWSLRTNASFFLAKEDEIRADWYGRPDSSFEGMIGVKPDSTTITGPLTRGRRWVIPSGEFSSGW